MKTLSGIARSRSSSSESRDVVFVVQPVRDITPVVESWDIDD